MIIQLQKLKVQLKMTPEIKPPYPKVIAFYNTIMCGVDLADQKVSMCDLDRKSTKWWK